MKDNAVVTGVKIEYLYKKNDSHVERVSLEYKIKTKKVNHLRQKPYTLYKSISQIYATYTHSNNIYWLL